MTLRFRKVGKAPRATRTQMGLAPVLPPNHCSHVVRFYTHRSKTAPVALIPDGSIAPWILLDQRASAYANAMLMPSRFNVI